MSFSFFIKSFLFFFYLLGTFFYLLGKRSLMFQFYVTSVVCPIDGCNKRHQDNMHSTNWKKNSIYTHSVPYLVFSSSTWLVYSLLGPSFHFVLPALFALAIAMIFCLITCSEQHSFTLPTLSHEWLLLDHNIMRTHFDKGLSYRSLLYLASKKHHPIQLNNTLTLSFSNQ